MKRVLRGIKGGIERLDLFDSGSLLRVKGEPEHKTLLGGMISLSVMLLLIATFYNRIIGTFNKVLITSSTSDSNAYDSSALNLTTVGKGPFMLGTEVFGHNLNEGSRYFDVVMTSYQQSFGVLTNTSETRLEPCTPDHWSGHPEIQAKFEPLNMAYWKCMPKDSQFQIQGKYSSQKYKSFSIEVRVCSNNSYDSRPCAPQAQIDEFFVDSEVNYLTVYFINPLINPENQDYLRYYLQDTNYITFSYDYGGEGLIYVDDYSIYTDSSILPTSSVQTESGGIVTKSAIKNTYLHGKETYAGFYFYKSSTSNNISRSYEKLDNVFSQIGGLFGTVLIFFFMVSSYNTYKFEVNLAGYLYRAERRGEGQGEAVDMERQAEGPFSPHKIEREYNFLHFLGQSLFQLLRLVGCRPQWQRVSRYHRVREEMLKQLDVLFLIKRLNFLERSLSFLFTAPQLKALYLASQPTMTDAAATRRNYKLKARLQTEIDRDRSSGNPSKNEASQLIFLQGNSCLKPPFAQQKHGSHLILGSDSYSSEESSSQQQQSAREPSLLREMAELQRDRENKTSRSIWLGIDQRLRKMIERTSPNQIFHDEINETKQNLLQSSRFQIIHANNIMLKTPSKQELSDDMQDNASANAELAKVMFARLRKVKVEREERLITADIPEE